MAECVWVCESVCRCMGVSGCVSVCVSVWASLVVCDCVGVLGCISVYVGISGFVQLGVVCLGVFVCVCVCECV